jgi:hypothetical protein
MVLVETPGVLQLAEIISVVHIWRRVKKAAIASSAAASSSVAPGCDAGRGPTGPVR